MKTAAVCVLIASALCLPPLLAYEVGEAHGEAAYAGQPSVLPDLGPPDPPTVAAPDPSADTLSFLSRVYQLYRDGALVPALILLAWGAAVFASRKWSKLREGRLAVYFAAGLTLLTMLAERASSGDTPTLAMLLSALASAVVLALRPQPSAPKPELKAVP